MKNLKVIQTISELKEVVNQNKDKNIALVPTMGALHIGHKSLIDKAVIENDFVIARSTSKEIEFLLDGSIPATTPDKTLGGAVRITVSS